MRGLEEIVKDNRKAVELGITKPGEYVGTSDMKAPVAALATKGHSAGQGGLRGHSIGKTYPWSVVGRGAGLQAVEWAVQNLLTGAWYHTREGDTPIFTDDADESIGMSCEQAHRIADWLKENGH